MTATRRAYLAWAVVCVVWGTTYLAIRVAIETIPPLLMAGVRRIVAGSVLIAILKVRGERLPGPRTWPALTLLGILLLGFGNGAVVWAEQTVPSGLAALLVAMIPFWLVSVDVAMGGQRLNARRTAGLAVGFAGIVLLVWPEIHVGAGGGPFLGGVISTQLACAGWALGSVYAKRRRQEENVIAVAAFQMLFGGICLTIVGLLIGERTVVAFSTRSTTALVYLMTVGSLVGFAAYTYALKHLPVATVSLYAYVNPLIAVALGTLVLDEPLNGRVVVAAGVVLAGMALVRN